jgi:SLOG family YspA-like protein
MKIEALQPSDVVILITGDRLWNDMQTIANVFATFPSQTVIVHGYARGADTMADIMAATLGIRRVRCPAHWQHNEAKCIEVWGRCDSRCNEVIGRAAGIIRNHSMFDAYVPVVVHGFHNNLDESRGTKDMLKYAQKAGVETWLHTSTQQFQEIDLLANNKSKKSETSVNPSDFFSFE